MIIKGNARAGAASLAEHLMRADTNERVELGGIRGVVAEDLLGALKEMEAVSACTNTRKPFYHASINVPIEERLTTEQRTYSIDRLEKELDLVGQPRAIVVHTKHDREHCHIVWSRTDLENSVAIRMDHNYRLHEIVSRELERTFGHARVQGAHVEREGVDRPARTPGHDEMQQASRTGLSPKAAKEQITALWQSTDSGRAFEAALAEQGWLLARGDRRDFVVVDPHGGTHSLARRVEGATAKDIRERMVEVDLMQLPTVYDARSQQLARVAPAPTPPTPAMDDDEVRRRAPVVDGLGWTDRAGMVAQQRSAMNWAEAADKAPAGQRPEKTLWFAEDHDRPSKPGVKKPSGASGGLNFFEDKNPEKDIDRD